MSTYLLAFIVSDYKENSNKDSIESGETIHTIYAKNEGIDRTRFALENSAALLKELENYVSIKFELTQVSHVAVPEIVYSNYWEFQKHWTVLIITFIFKDAMENWGAIFYKEQLLIGDEASHHNDIFRTLTVIAHELAHQFFGEKWNLNLQEAIVVTFNYPVD